MQSVYDAISAGTESKVNKFYRQKVFQTQFEVKT